MVRVRVPGLLLSILLASSASGQSNRTIEIPLAMTASRATDLVQRVALRRDVAIVSNEGGVVLFESIHPVKNNPTVVNLRANVVRTSDSTSIVAISGRWYSPLTAQLQRAVVGGAYAMQEETGEPVEQATKGWKAQLWAVVRDFADAVTVAASPATSR
jgi:hypothetical protein